MPEWGTGGEVAVSTRSSVFVATAPDTEGAVEILVEIGHAPEAKGPEVLVAVMEMASSEIEIGSPLAGMVQKISLGFQGMFNLHVFCDIVPGARQVTFFIKNPNYPNAHSK